MAPFTKPVGLAGPLKAGDKLTRDIFANEELEPNTQFSFTVVLDEPPIIQCQPLLPTLVGMADHVDDLIMNFKSLLT